MNHDELVRAAQKRPILAAVGLAIGLWTDAILLCAFWLSNWWNGTPQIAHVDLSFYHISRGTALFIRHTELPINSVHECVDGVAECLCD